MAGGRVSECKHCGMESEHCHYCCDGSHVDLLEKEVALLTKKLEGLENIDEISAGYRDLAQKAIDSLHNAFGFADKADELQKEFDEVGE